jgi:purine catabolism regulator
LLLALDRRDSDMTVLDRLGRAVDRVTRLRLAGTSPEQLLMAAGTVVAGLRDARRSVVEAQQVADAAAHLPGVSGFVRLHDVGVRGLLSLLREDPRIETFVDRELGPLLDRSDDLLAVLRAYLSCGRNKSAAAAAMHLSRPAFYDRLTRLGTVLDADLEDVETCLALHVALLARDTR